MKKGIHSTEFWLNLIGVLGGVITAMMGESQWAVIAGSILSAVCGASYTAGRSVVKSRETLLKAAVASTQRKNGVEADIKKPSVD
jgi:hypothetical protein